MLLTPCHETGSEYQHEVALRKHYILCGTGASRMKRVAEWVVYVIGAVAIGYFALYAYAMFTRPQLVPGEPIQILRKPDAPSYS
jgi:hypothetical protein